ncbi:3-hydroxyacyl-CoA dehydrogenase NAD-binding domain-containing protein [Wenjunlia tyrosinilytica]|uniref:3-hydroxyacyl-CoA dehydrogenase n=1 Tax=Wenjunlia tyrosinilytica TaxID=1544741 RepID=A0A917ZM74_9ACTN|nr:3-hydroxyacyl-CoA dehydrogenase NAD-binding domain-containing protein [Wenjunlia tyrosinilytica]GGO86042.1 3-hydroxyacyl-CoA dehydrogenase [Wenjunlia tyrosinilytica]
MDELSLDRTVAVVGSGTMGRGIAQVALTAGHPVLLYDAAPGTAERAARAIGERLDRLVEKGRMSAEQRAGAGARLVAAGQLSELAPAGLVVEAIVEDLAVKQRLFADLEGVVADDCLLATNTSSLPVTAVAAPLRLPGRFVGLHFFNPAPVLPLVEVVSGAATDRAAADRAHATARAWGKTPVRCTDSPGFIVNRVARPFYAEAFRVYEERGADPATIDAVLRESGGFAMGPFELTDLIGQDVNEAVTTSVWTAFGFDPRFTPSLAQRQLVQSGRIGRKSGHGWYAYGEGAERPIPHTAAPAKAPESVVLHGDLGPAVELVPMLEEAGIEVVRGQDHGARGPEQADQEQGGPEQGGPEQGGPEGGQEQGGQEQGGHGSGVPGSPGRLELPGGAVLRLTTGLPATTAEGPPVVLFDLALDYRTAGRIALAASDTAPPSAVEEAAGLFQALGKQVSLIDDIPGMIVARTVAMLVDFANDAVARGVASPEDVDTAMRLGVNYPLGPLEWGRRLTAARVVDLLDALGALHPGGRYAPCVRLRRRAAVERSRRHE